MTATPDLQGAGERVEVLLGRFAGPLAPQEAHAAAEELVRILTELYGAGLERTLDVVHEFAGDRSQTIFDALAADKLVASLLILHGLHPLSVEERVAAALDGVRPYLNSHEGISRSLGLARASCTCAWQEVVMAAHHRSPPFKLTVERAILEAAPEITEVRAQGISAADKAERYDSGWIELGAHPQLLDGGTSATEVDGMPVLLVGDGRLVHAYRNQCPRCLRGLGSATLRWPMLACAGCGQSYDVADAGLAEGDDTLAIEVLPVAFDVHDAQRVRLAIPTTA